MRGLLTSPYIHHGSGPEFREQGTSVPSHPVSPGFHVTRRWSHLPGAEGAEGGACHGHATAPPSPRSPGHARGSGRPPSARQLNRADSPDRLVAQVRGCGPGPYGRRRYAAERHGTGAGGRGRNGGLRLRRSGRTGRKVLGAGPQARAPSATWQRVAFRLLTAAGRSPETLRRKLPVTVLLRWN
jgi:hypothetical protein